MTYWWTCSRRLLRGPSLSGLLFFSCAFSNPTFSALPHRPINFYRASHMQHKRIARYANGRVYVGRSVCLYVRLCQDAVHYAQTYTKCFAHLCQSSFSSLKRRDHAKSACALDVSRFSCNSYIVTSSLMKSLTAVNAFSAAATYELTNSLSSVW